MQFEQRRVQHIRIPPQTWLFFLFLNKNVFYQVVQRAEPIAVHRQFLFILKYIFTILLNDLHTEIIAITKFSIIRPQKNSLIQMVHDDAQC